MNYINLDKINKTAPLIPYPDWKANTLPETSNEPLEQNHITSVFRVYVDECDRLWVMDTGVAQILGNYNPIAKPSILVFDLNTDTLIRRYTLKETDAKDNSFFANVVSKIPFDLKCIICVYLIIFKIKLFPYNIIFYFFKNFS